MARTARAGRDAGRNEGTVVDDTEAGEGIPSLLSKRRKHPHLADAAGTRRIECRFSCCTGQVLDLSPDQVSAAEFVGVAFLPARPEQVDSLAMQRKVFHIDGTPVLATRDGGFFETAATLARLIAQGETQRRDVEGWQAVATPAAPEPEPEAPPPRKARPPADQEAPRHEAAPVDESPDISPAAAEVLFQRRAGQQRWVTAGAERRGRVSQHWSARRK